MNLVQPHERRANTTPLFSLDARVKMIGVALLSLSVARAGIVAVGLAVLIETVLISRTDSGFSDTLKRMRPAWVLLALVFAARVYATPGFDLLDPTSKAAWQTALTNGSLVCGRLLAVIFLGLLLIVTTPAAEIRSATAWFFKPVPFIPEKRVATMLSLLLRFIPLIFKQSSDALDAQRARGVDQIRNPIRRMVLLVLPLARRTFQTADNLAIAMEARCYSSDQPAALHFHFKRRDWIASAIILLSCALMILSAN